MAKSSSSENTGSRSVHFLPSAKYAYNTQHKLQLQVCVNKTSWAGRLCTTAVGNVYWGLGIDTKCFVPDSNSRDIREDEGLRMGSEENGFNLVMATERKDRKENGISQIR